MRIWRPIADRFNSDNSRIVAALMDTVAAFVVIIGVTVLYLEVVNFLGTHYPTGTREVLGYTRSSNYVNWPNLIMVCLFAAQTGALSATAMMFAHSERRPRRAKRSVVRTVIALTIAIASTTYAGILMTGGEVSISSTLECLAALGFVGVPAALRLTSPKAFSYRCPSPETIIAGRISNIDETP